MRAYLNLLICVFVGIADEVIVIRRGKQFDARGGVFQDFFRQFFNACRGVRCELHVVLRW